MQFKPYSVPDIPIEYLFNGEFVYRVLNRFPYYPYIDGIRSNIQDGYSYSLVQLDDSDNPKYYDISVLSHQDIENDVVVVLDGATVKLSTKKEQAFLTATFACEAMEVIARSEKEWRATI